MRAAPIFRRRGGPPRASPGRGGRAFRPLGIRRARRVGRHSLRLCLGWRRDPAGAVLIRRLIETATPADRLDGTFGTRPPHPWSPPPEDLAEDLLAPSFHRGRASQNAHYGNLARSLPRRVINAVTSPLMSPTSRAPRGTSPQVMSVMRSH